MRRDHGSGGRPRSKLSGAPTNGRRVTANQRAQISKQCNTHARYAWAPRWLGLANAQPPCVAGRDRDP